MKSFIFQYVKLKYHNIYTYANYSFFEPYMPKEKVEQSKVTTGTIWKKRKRIILSMLKH